MRAPEVKSTDQRWFASCGIVNGARVPQGRLRTIDRSSF